MTVTVKRTDDGYVELVVRPRPRRHEDPRTAPSGTFVPKTLDTDFLLLAAGSGITLMMAICKSAPPRAAATSC